MDKSEMFNVRALHDSNIEKFIDAKEKREENIDVENVQNYVENQHETNKKVENAQYFKNQHDSNVEWFHDPKEKQC